MYPQSKQDVKISIFLVLIGQLSASSLQHQLNVTILQNEPHIYQKNGNYSGTLVELLSSFNKYYGPACGPRGLYVKYGPQVATYSELLDLIKESRFATSDSTIFALAPVLPTTMDHSYMFAYNIHPILYSPGYTLVAGALTQTKIYRLVVFGFLESATLLVILILATVSVGSIVWFLERNKSAENSCYSYHVIPGLWDGFWWAAVTISTVGYGDKVPKTVFGRALGVLWLFFTCTLLASFGAIMTSSVTAEAVSISGLKIAYLEHTTAKDVIVSNAGLPIATKTPEQAWELARNSEVYGAMLDTNYVSHMQDQLYDKGVLIDQRFHGGEQLAVRIWFKRPSSNTSINSNNSCFDTLMSFFNSTKDKLKYMQPMLKKNRHTTLSERLKPDSFNNYGLLISYCLTGCVLAMAIIVGIVDYLHERKAKRAPRISSVTIQEKSKDELVEKLLTRVETLCSEITEIKSMIKETDAYSKKILDFNEAKTSRRATIVTRF